jgi:hypothetical protein
MITIQRKVKLGRSSRKPKKGAAAPVGRPPRVARLMALAIRFDQMIRDGVVADQAELARLGRVSRARVTQIMNLLSLAPDIQESLLFLDATTRGRDRISERELRPITGVADWCKQHRAWNRLKLTKSNAIR